LQREDILAANVFLNFDEDFLIRKAPDARFSERRVQVPGDGLGQHPI
jgi:hypothetical protein